jgi:NAD(P)-dependent dehydrogenase (short-subunit alcohol dehydrogenase family)
MKDVEGKVAFVTGGASGIGLGIVCAFLDAGMKIAIGDSSQERLEQALNYLGKVEGRVHPVLVDVTNRRGLENAAVETVNTFGRIHVLVNNAGVQNPSTLLNTSHEDWDRMVAVNLGGVFHGIQAFLPRIKQHSEGGHVVTTASMVGLFTVGSGYGAYCASKFGAVAMMETLRADLSESNIGVSILCPGPVKSNLEKHLKDSKVALEPLEIGRLALQGMRKNALYILTHPEFNVLIQARNDAVMASAPKGANPGDERIAVAQSTLQNSIYLTCTNGL